MERDNYTCQKCGYVGKRRKSKPRRWSVSVHHITKIKNFANTKTGEVDYKTANDLSNLVTLCDRCHKAADGHTPLKGFSGFRGKI